MEEEWEEADVARLVDVLRHGVLQHPPRHLGTRGVRVTGPGEEGVKSIYDVLNEIVQRLRDSCTSGKSAGLTAIHK